MSGIVGYVGRKQAGPVILQGLRRLEYRGHDSAGLAVGTTKTFDIRQASGTLRNLEAAVRLDPIRGTFGVGCTGWTSGRASLADPDRPTDAVHDGIVVAVAGKPSNLWALREKLPHPIRQGAGTDSETLALLVASHSGEGVPLEQAVMRAATRDRRQLRHCGRIEAGAGQDRRRAAGTGHDDRTGEWRVPRVLGHVGDPQPHPRHHPARGPRRGGPDPTGRPRHRCRGESGLPNRPSRPVGPADGGEERLQALPSEGDLRAAPVGP